MITEHSTVRSGALAVELTLTDGRLSSVDLPETVPDGLDAAMLADVLRQLAGYDLHWSGTPPFLRKVRERMQQIPAGSAMTYRDLAEAVGSPRAMRAVGQACATNRLPLVVPCHRVLGEDGIGGFALGLEWKRTLLELESELAERN